MPRTVCVKICENNMAILPRLIHPRTRHKLKPTMEGRTRTQLNVLKRGTYVEEEEDVPHPSEFIEDTSAKTKQLEKELRDALGLVVRLEAVAKRQARDSHLDRQNRRDAVQHCYVLQSRVMTLEDHVTTLEEELWSTRMVQFCGTVNFKDVVSFEEEEEEEPAKEACKLVDGFDVKHLDFEEGLDFEFVFE